MVTKKISNAYERWLKKQTQMAATQPLSRPVASNENSYMANVGYSKLGWQHFRRAMVFAVSGQNKFLQARIQPRWKKALWLYKGIPQIGDSLMDLAPRSLLRQQGIQVDLYTDSHLAALYQDDPWFDRVLDDPSDVYASGYDFVILPSHKNRSLKAKSRLLPHAPWVSIHGFYTGPDFHRSRFATQRLLDLMDQQVSQEEFNLHEAQKLGPLDATRRVSGDCTKIALALGGVNPPRTYGHWPALAKAMANELGNVEFTLLGSSNAISAANIFSKECEGLFPIVNQAGKTSLQECRTLIHMQDLFISADGGLMHLGATTATPMVSLFNSEISPLWQLSEPHPRSALQSQTSEVSDLSVQLILDTILTTMQCHPMPRLQPGDSRIIE